MENFLIGLGYDTVLHEKGGVTYIPDIELDRSCVREVQNADIYILILGGRYGSESSASRGETGGASTSDQYSRYNSVTRTEFQEAVSKHIPTYVLIERPVQDEYATFQKNRSRDDIEWAHVDSVNVFEFIEEILALQRNNPVFAFERFSEIEHWLREQFSGLFQNLLRGKSQAGQLTSLSEQVGQLQDASQILQKYMSEVLLKAVPDQAESIISEEERNAGERQKARAVAANKAVVYISNSSGISVGTVVDWLKSSSDFVEFARRFPGIDSGQLVSWYRRNDQFRADLNEARKYLGLHEWGEISSVEFLGFMRDLESTESSH